jgi:hypothetical protein
MKNAADNEDVIWTVQITKGDRKGEVAEMISNVHFSYLLRYKDGSEEWVAGDFFEKICRGRMQKLRK